jgi:hypothetical protein
MFESHFPNSFSSLIYKIYCIQLIKKIKHPNTTKTNACPTGHHTLILFQRSLVVQILERTHFFAI